PSRSEDACHSSARTLRPRKGDVADRRPRIDRAEAAQGLFVPITVTRAAMAGGLPTPLWQGRQRLHQPMHCSRHHTFLDQGHAFRVGDEIAVQFARPDKGAMRRLLIVEMEAVVAMTDGVDAFV